MAFLKPIVDAANALDTLDRSRKKKVSKYGQAFRASKDFVESFYWLPQVPPALPAQQAKNQMESFQFNQNRCKVDECKEPLREMYKWLKKQCDYIKENDLKTGMIWNAKGGDLSAASKDAPAAEPAKVEKKEVEKETPKKAPKKTGGTAGFAAEIGQGLKITAGLKKVKKSQKTKYRKDRAGKVTTKVRK